MAQAQTLEGLLYGRLNNSPLYCYVSATASSFLYPMPINWIAYSYLNLP